MLVNLNGGKSVPETFCNGNLLSLKNSNGMHGTEADDSINIDRIFGERKLINVQYKSVNKNKICEISSLSINCTRILDIEEYVVSQNTIYVSTKRNIQSRDISDMKLVNYFEHDADRISYCNIIDYFSISCKVSACSWVKNVKPCSICTADTFISTVKTNGLISKPVIINSETSRGTPASLYQRQFFWKNRGVTGCRANLPYFHYGCKKVDFRRGLNEINFHEKNIFYKNNFSVNEIEFISKMNNVYDDLCTVNKTSSCSHNVLYKNSFENCDGSQNKTTNEYAYNYMHMCHTYIRRHVLYVKECALRLRERIKLLFLMRCSKSNAMRIIKAYAHQREFYHMVYAARSRVDWRPISFKAMMVYEQNMLKQLKDKMLCQIEHKAGALEKSKPTEHIIEPAHEFIFPSFNKNFQNQKPVKSDYYVDDRVDHYDANVPTKSAYYVDDRVDVYDTNEPVCKPCQEPEYAFMVKETASSKDAYTHIPAYDKDNYQRWARNFVISLSDNLNEIIENTYTSIRPTKASDAALDPDQIEALEEKYRVNYEKKNKKLYQNINYALTKSNDPSSYALISDESTVRRFDGKAAFEAILNFHNDPSLQNKLAATQEFLSVKQEARETPLEFKSKVNLLFQRLESLKVTFDDLKAIKYLTGLKPRYATIVNTISVRGGKLDIDDIYKAVGAYDQRKSIAENELAKTHYVDENDDEDSQYITPKKKKSSEERLIKKVEKLHKQVALLTKANNKPQQQPQQKPKKLHDPWNHEDTPTEYEKTLTCDSCGMLGHAKRTCKRLNRDDSRKTVKKKRNLKPLRSEKAKSATALMATTGYNEHVMKVPTGVKFLADSGASQHMIGQDKAKFVHSIVPDVREIQTASGKIFSSGAGALGSLAKVLIVPGIQANLFSIPQAVKEGYVAVFEQGKFNLYKPEQVHTSGCPVLQGKHKHGAYEVEIPIQPIQDGDVEK
jgi:hypothetical protein